MAHDLSQKKIAVLVADGFEEVEFTKPIEALRQANAEVHVVSPAGTKVKAWNETDWGESYKVDVPLEKASAGDYHALVLPGGVMNPDNLRMEEKAIEFTRDFFRQNKPVAAICHGPQILIDADVLSGRTLTSYPSVRVDITNAGGSWLDQEVVVDEGLVTSRKPADLKAFCTKMVEEFAEGRHAGQTA